MSRRGEIAGRRRRAALVLATAGAISVLSGVSAGIAASGGVTVREMIGNPLYWPPPCETKVCVLTGLGGIVQVWLKHVDRNLALGRTFVVDGVCASACEMAARRAKAKLLPGARLIPHPAGKTVWQ